MKFADIVGQDHIAANLRQSLLSGRLSHAQMLLGPEGNGSLPLALAFVQYINCENRTESDSCGSCPSCVKAEKYIHPDIHFSFPFVKVDSGPKSGRKLKCTDYLTDWRQVLLENPYLSYQDWMQHIQLNVLKSASSNKQGNISAQECLDINHKLSLTTFESEHKILLMWLPEFLGKEGNRMLKLIEEPPVGTIFIFVAQDADAILGTIRSRTQIIRVPRYENEKLAEGLVRNFNLDEQKAIRLASLADGNLNSALHMLKQPRSEEDTLFHQWLQTSLHFDLPSLYEWMDDFHKLSREQHKNFFRYGLLFVREQLMAAYTGEAIADDPTATKLAERLHFEDWEKLATTFDKAYTYTERNANDRLIMINLSIQLSRIYQSRDPRLVTRK